jgi:hypothetical protein
MYVSEFTTEYISVLKSTFTLLIAWTVYAVFVLKRFYFFQSHKKSTAASRIVFSLKTSIFRTFPLSLLSSSSHWTASPRIVFFRFDCNIHRFSQGCLLLPHLYSGFLSISLVLVCGRTIFCLGGHLLRTSEGV